MKKVIVDPINNKLLDVVDVVDVFPIAPPWFWADCPDETIPELDRWDGTTVIVNHEARIALHPIMTDVGNTVVIDF